MSTRKTRTLRLADGGQFRIGPNTVSVHVSTLPLDPPAVLLHINRSCGALELEPLANGTPQPPIRLNARRVVEIVEQINNERFRDSVRGEKAEPPVELPPTFKRTARHIQAWQMATPWYAAKDCVGYPGKLPHEREHTLWVHRETGSAMLERPGTKPGTVDVRRLTAPQAVEWLAEHGYQAVPATLHRLARTGKGATVERPRKR